MNRPWRRRGRRSAMAVVPLSLLLGFSVLGPTSLGVAQEAEPEVEISEAVPDDPARSLAPVLEPAPVVPSAPAPPPPDRPGSPLTGLEQLGQGTLPERTPVESLFQVSLDDLEKVDTRIAQLRLELAEARIQADEAERAIERLDAEAAADPEPQMPALLSPVPIAAPDPTPVEAGVLAEQATEAAEDKGESDGAGLEAAGDLEESAANAISAAQATALRDAEVMADFEAQYGAWRGRRDERALSRARTLAEQRAAIDALEIGEHRLAYLEKLSVRLSNMSEASRQLLPALRRPRKALRAQADRLADLAIAAGDAGSRLGVVADRSASGMLVGFVSEQRTISAELAASAQSHRTLSQRLEAVSVELAQHAQRLESEGQHVRSVFLRTIAQQGGASEIDRLFEQHLRDQRRLRKSVSEVFTSSDAATFERLRAEANQIAPNPLAIGTTGAGRAVLEAAMENRIELETVTSAEAGGVPAWDLAFENEVMTVLSEVASESARSSAYGFSSELLDDVASEATLAWRRTVAGFEKQRSALPTWTALATTSRGQGVLFRLGAVLALVFAWLLARREAPRLAISSVRSLSRMPSMRSHIGLLVRWSGLLQSVVPSLVGIIALQLGLWILGRETGVAQVLRVLLLPLLLYEFGRQLLVGATRRITTGRPALIAMREETRVRLQKTYANLGIVVAAAFMIDGLARVAIGAGRVVFLIDSVVVAWLFLWMIWEAVRWREPLAKAWHALLPEDETESAEDRATAWMAGSALGCVLSPVALLRVIGTPVVRFFQDFAGDTNLVQSVRAWLLRRRSSQAEAPVAANIEALPEEYREAFPLYPILGEDEALLVARSELIDGVVAQWQHWQEARVDGSLAVIGEKGAGKTTLAAQIARRTSSLPVIQHTIRGKPKEGKGLVTDLATAFGFDRVDDVQDLAERLCAGGDQVVVLDEVHNVFLRYVDGYRAYDALVELVNATTSKVFWVLVFNSFTWQFLNQSRGRVHYFRRLLHVPKWTPEEIQSLIRLRNKRTGYELRFDEVLLSDARTEDQSIALVEEAEGYFRLLWESSGGNPRVATHLWLSSLRRVAENTLRVGLFQEPNTEVLSELQDELVFSLAAITQHENLTAEELALVMNVSEPFARFAIQFLSESKFIESKDSDPDRFTLAPLYYRAVLRALRKRHLLFESS